MPSAIGGDPEHRFTQGSCARRSTSTWTASTAPTACCTRCGASGSKGEGRFERISWDEALDEIADRLRDRRRARRRRPSCRTPTRATWECSATAAWTAASSTRWAPACSTARSARAPAAKAQGDLRQDDRLRPRGGRPCAADRLLGRQHRELQRAPVAARRRGAAEGRAARADRPLPLANRREGGPAPRPPPGTDARARARA